LARGPVVPVVHEPLHGDVAQLDRDIRLPDGSGLCSLLPILSGRFAVVATEEGQAKSFSRTRPQMR